MSQSDNQPPYRGSNAVKYVIPLGANGVPYGATPVGNNVVLAAGFVNTGLAPPATADYAVVYAEVTGIRWTDDGTTAPTTAAGTPLLAGASMTFCLADLTLIHVAAMDGTSKGYVHYYKS